MSVINACGFSICDGICIPFRQLCKYFTLCNDMIMKKIVSYHSYPLMIADRGQHDSVRNIGPVIRLYAYFTS